MILVLTLLASLAWSGGKKEESGEKDPIYLRMYYPVGVAGALAKLMDEMVADFNKSQNNVTVESIFAGGYREAMEKAQTAFLAGKPPALAVLDAPTLYTLRDIDAIVPLDDYIAKEGGDAYVAEFLPAFMEIARAEGKIWSIPWQRSTPIFYYNKDFFREVGLDPDKPPATWAELIDYGKKLRKVDSSGNVTRWGVEYAINFWLFKPLLLQAGGELDNEAGTKLSIDTPESKEVFQFLLDMAHKHKIMPAVKQWAETVSDFVAGTTAMLYNSTGALTHIRKAIKYEFGTAFLPSHKRQVCIEGGGNFFIFKTDEGRQQAAWEVIKWMTKPENTARWSLGSGYIPVKQAAFDVPEYKEYTDKWPQALTAYKQLTQVDTERNMMTHAVNEIVKLVNTTTAEILGGADLDATLKRAQAEADKILEAFQ